MKYRVSKTKAKEFAQKMNEIQNFCDENFISYSNSSDSYYFTVNGVKYRVSNHTIATSNKKAYDFKGEKKRDLYHSDNEYVCITASKTRIIEIYTNILSGKTLNKRGFVKELL